MVQRGDTLAGKYGRDEKLLYRPYKELCRLQNAMLNDVKTDAAHEKKRHVAVRAGSVVGRGEIRDVGGKKGRILHHGE